jgi:3-oxoadipate enol-lactonase
MTDPLVLLHGAPFTPEVWDDVRAQLTDAPVYCPDVTPDVLPSASTPTPLRSEPTTNALVERLRATLTPDPARFHLVGHAFGGQVAIDLASAAPDRVSRITLLCSRDTPFPRFSATAVSLRSGIRPPPGPTLARWFRPGELATNGPVVQYARRRLERASLEPWAVALESIAGYERPMALANLGIPVMLIACEFDAVASPATMREMADRIPGATFQQLTGAARLSPFLHPRALAGLLRGG